VIATDRDTSAGGFAEEQDTETAPAARERPERDHRFALLPRASSTAPHSEPENAATKIASSTCTGPRKAPIIAAILTSPKPMPSMPRVTL
jgi:hypothetical protein